MSPTEVAVESLVKDIKVAFNIALVVFVGAVAIIVTLMWPKPRDPALLTMPAVLNRAEIMCAKFGGQPKVRDVVARTKNGTKLLDLHVSCRGDLTFIIHTIEDNR